ncbi:MAG TPA: hypothetical protein VIL88_06115 [Devosia sp.]|jgi:hypothetical protein|uniref:hypothetical protein n=1 Tax=Devosia sp. TaxID=1871048 RepID=UPI002F92C29F
MSRKILTSLAILSAMTAPALAVPVCSGSYAMDQDWYTEKEITDFYEMDLRSRGVNAKRVELWSGCIRAYVTLEDGTEEMQFFEPLGLRRVY